MPKHFIVSYRELAMTDTVPKTRCSTLSNISAGGIMFEADHDFPLDTMIILQLKIDQWEKFADGFFKFDQQSISKPFTAIGRIVWTKEVQGESRHLLGVVLDNVDETHRKAFTRYLEHIVASASAAPSN